MYHLLSLAQKLKVHVCFCRAGKENLGLYSLSVTDALLAYPSSTYWDDLAWGAVWLYTATNNATYLNESQLYFTNAEADGTMVAPTPLAWNWDNQLPGVAFMLAKISGWQNATIVEQVSSICTQYAGLRDASMQALVSAERLKS